MAANPGDLIRRFVLDFLVEEALRTDPSLGGDGRAALSTSFSIEPLVDLGNIRKYRIISTEFSSNRRVYLFMFQRVSTDRAFSTTELCFRRCLTVLRDQDSGVHRRDRDVLIREVLKRHRSVENMGLLLTDVVVPRPDIPLVEQGPYMLDIPRSLIDLGVLEVYPQGSLAYVNLPPIDQRRMTPARSRQKSESSVPIKPQEERPKVDLSDITVQEWLTRAFSDTFGHPPIHISLSSSDGPIFTIRVAELTEAHQRWALEVTRHLRIREGSIKLEVQLLMVK